MIAAKKVKNFESPPLLSKLRETEHKTRTHRFAQDGNSSKADRGHTIRVVVSFDLLSNGTKLISFLNVNHQPVQSSPCFLCFRLNIWEILSSREKLSRSV